MRPRRRHEATGRRLDDRGPCGPLLVGVPGRRVPRSAVAQVGGHRAHDLGRLVERAQELVDVLAGRLGDVGEPAVDEDEAGAALAEPRRGRRRHDRRRTVTGEHDRAVLERARSLGDRDDVAGSARPARTRRSPSARPTGRGRGGPSRSSAAAAAQTRRATGVQAQALAGEPVDEHDARAPGPAPVEEVDPVARLDRTTNRRLEADRLGAASHVTR